MKYLFLLFIVYQSTHRQQLNAQSVTSEHQEKALQVLEQKCNVCHRKWQTNKLFTRENMSSFAVQIHEQVFLLKRMPKGRRVFLSEADKKALISWINEVKVKSS